MGPGQDPASGAFPHQAEASEAFPRRVAAWAGCPRQGAGTALARGPDHRLSSCLDLTRGLSRVIVPKGGVTSGPALRRLASRYARHVPVERLLGQVGVDSGIVAIGDPCYLVQGGAERSPEWQEVVAEMFDAQATTSSRFTASLTR